VPVAIARPISRRKSACIERVRAAASFMSACPHRSGVSAQPIGRALPRCLDQALAR
jgi:hypothetical protein